MSDPAQSASAIRRNRRFYDRWRHAYDLFTRRILPLTGPRATATTALAIDDGDHVVEFGCGTGPNVPHVARAMASHDACRYTGIDIAPQAIRRARALVARRRWANMTFAVGDATDPPLARPVDAVLSTFVATIFPDPAAVVRRWLDLLAPDGRLVLLNSHPSSGRRGRVLNPFYNAFLVTANPIDVRSIRSNPPWTCLRRRLAAVESTLEQEARSYERDEFYGGLLSLSVAKP